MSRLRRPTLVFGVALVVGISLAGCTQSARPVPQPLPTVLPTRSTPVALWSARANAVVAADRAFVLTSAGFGAFDARTGRRLWLVKASGERPDLAGDGVLVSSLTAARGRAPLAVTVYVRETTVRRLGDGRLLWRLPTPGVQQFPARVLADGLLVAADPDGTVTAYPATSGARRWRTVLSPCVGTKDRQAPLELTATADTVVAIGCIGAATHLVGLNAATGAQLWQRTLRAAPWDLDVRLTQPPAAATGGVVLLRTTATRLTSAAAVRARDPSAQIWTQPTDSDGGDVLLALDAATGGTLWRERLVPRRLAVAAAGGWFCLHAAPSPRAAATECRATSTGRLSWSSATGPALSGDPLVGVATDGGRSATVESVGDGAYQLVVRDLTTGRVTAKHDVPVPPLNQLSLSQPPQVAGSAADVVLVTDNTGDHRALDAYLLR